MNYPYNNYAMQNPYMYDRQQMFQAQQMPVVRSVNNFNEISASDVSMTSPYSVFVKNDMSELQIRRWNASGMIDNLTFKPVLEQRVDNVTSNAEKLKFEPSDEFTKALNDRFDMLEMLISEKQDKEVK